MALPSNLSLSQLALAPSAWDPVFIIAPRKPSAVLILFVEPEDQVQAHKIILIRRSTRVGSHRGQIGFPGGRLEASDASPTDTALRESREELGIDPTHVKVLGVIHPLPALDGSLVYPVVGLIREVDYTLTPSPDEVQAVHAIAWNRLSRNNRQCFSFNMFGCWRDSFLYDCGSITVWGLSAEILSKAAF